MPTWTTTQSTYKENKNKKNKTQIIKNKKGALEKRENVEKNLRQKKTNPIKTHCVIYILIYTF